MSHPFPDDQPFLQGRHAPITFEASAHDLPVSGAIPEELAGTLYRNGPNPQYAPRDRYHWFLGDGMVHAFQIARGRVSYRNRWVRTPKWTLERTLGEALAPDDARLEALDSSLANTNIVWHAGKLLALEETHAPVAVDPDTLATLGRHDFASAFSGPFTAHPKIDPRTGELLFFAYGAARRCSPVASLGVVDAAGRLARHETMALPFASMMHDFAVTERWIVLPVFPLPGSLERAASGRSLYAWEPALGAHVALVPRGGSAAETRWFEGDACYVFHFMNAFDADDGSVVVDAMKYPRAPLFPTPDGAMPAEPPRASLVRWTFDPRAPGGGWREELITPRDADFPRTDDRFASRAYRHGYIRTDAEETGAAGIAHVDLATKRLAEWQPGGGDACDEAVFVPRSAGAAEGDGWLVTVVYRRSENRSDLAVLDARDVAAGPIALAHLSHRVPAGFHGNWRSARI